MSAHRKMQQTGKMEAASVSAWETILNACESDDVSCNHRLVEQQQVESRPVPGREDASIATTLEDVTANELKGKVGIALTEIPDMMEKAAEQLFCTSIPNARKARCTVVYDN